MQAGRAGPFADAARPHNDYVSPAEASLVAAN